MKPLSIATLSTLFSLRSSEEKQKNQVETAPSGDVSSADDFGALVVSPPESPDHPMAAPHALKVLRWADAQAPEAGASGPSDEATGDLGAPQEVAGARHLDGGAPSESVLNWRRSLLAALEAASPEQPSADMPKAPVEGELAAPEGGAAAMEPPRHVALPGWLRQEPTQAFAEGPRPAMQAGLAAADDREHAPGGDQTSMAAAFMAPIPVVAMSPDPAPEPEGQSAVSALASAPDLESHAPQELAPAPQDEAMLDEAAPDLPQPDGDLPASQTAAPASAQALEEPGLSAATVTVREIEAAEEPMPQEELAAEAAEVAQPEQPAPHDVPADDGVAEESVATVLEGSAEAAAEPDMSASSLGLAAETAPRADQSSALAGVTGTPRPNTSHGLGHQVADALLNAPNRGVELTLAPEELGKVRMTLRPHEGSMTVTVQAERPDTLELMRRHIDSLAREFREMGYADVSFDFGQTPDQPQSGAQERLAEALESQDSTAPQSATVAEAVVETAEGGLDLRM